MPSFWPSALRIGWRDMRARPGRFVCAALSIAIGTGAFVATALFRDAFLTAVQSESKPMLAADLSVRLFVPPADAQRAELEQLARSGASWTLVTERLAQAEIEGEPRMIVVKAVDVARYPFYGELLLQPPARLAAALDDHSTVISPEMAARWNIAQGSAIRIGEQGFRVSAVIASEPDRWAEMRFPFERAILTPAGLTRAGLDLPLGGVHRLLVRLNSDASVDEVHRRLERIFPEGKVLDLRSPDPGVAEAIQRVGAFLGLASGASLLLGALAVAFAIFSNIEQHMDSVAFLKSLGGRSSQIMKIFLGQTILLTIAGSVLGLALGLAAAHWLPLVIRDYAPVPVRIGFRPAILLQALGLGLTAGVLFTVLPLARVRDIPPAVVLRRDMLENRTKPGRTSVREWMRERLLLWSGPVLACWLISALASGSVKTGTWFTGGLGVSAFALAGFSALLIAKLRRLPRYSGLPAWVRHGLANIHRPGSYAAGILAVLGAGAALMLGVELLRYSVVRRLIEDTAPGSENLFLLNVRPEDTEDLQALLAKTPGVLVPLRLLPGYSMRLMEVNGVAQSDSGEARSGRLRQSWVATALDKEPENQPLAIGRWWRSGASEVVLSERAAQGLQVTIGDRLGFLYFGREIRVSIAGIGRVQSGVAFRPDLVFPAALLAGLPTQFAGGVRCDPRRLPAIERAIYQDFPSVSAIDLVYLLDSTRHAVGRIAALLRFVSLFVGAGGALILASSVIASSVRRRRENAVLRALGATRRQAAAVATVEFFALGTIAGGVGSLLAAALSAFVMNRVFGLAFWSMRGFWGSAALWRDWPALLFTILGAATLTTAVGWISSYHLLRGSTLEVLRRE